MSHKGAVRLISEGNKSLNHQDNHNECSESLSASAFAEQDQPQQEFDNERRSGPEIKSGDHTDWQPSSPFLARRYAQQNMKEVASADSSVSADTRPTKKRGTWKINLAIFFAIMLLIAGIVMLVKLQGANERVVITGPGYTEPEGDMPAFEVPTIPQEDESVSQEVPEPTTRAELPLPKIGTDEQIVIGETSPVADIAEFVSPSVVAIVSKINIDLEDGEVEEYDASSSSGIVLSEDGYIVTNQHVIGGYDEIYVVFAGEDSIEYKAEIIGYDEIRDLAVIKVDRTCQPAMFGDSDLLRPGESAISIGNSLGIGSGTVTQGVISAVNRLVPISARYKQAFIQTDAAINPGNSGGALVNMQAEVIGISTLKYTTAGYSENGETITAEGVGYAIPINDAMPVIEELIRYGYASKPPIPAIGLTGSDISYQETKDLLEKIPSAPTGILVFSTVEGGPADTAQLQENDIIIAIDNQKVMYMSELTDYISYLNVGDEVTLTVWRQGETIQITVILGDYNEMEYDAVTAE